MKLGLKFDFEWRLTAFVVVMVPILIGFGFWQLDRAEEKRVLMQQAIDRQQALPLNGAKAMSKLSDSDLNGMPITLEGAFLSPQFLLDNQIKRGRFGNDVIQVFQDETGGLFFVNRGWVPADPSRQSDTVIPITELDSNIAGSIYISPGDAFLLADDLLQDQAFPITAQAFDAAAFSSRLPSSAMVFPHLIRLREDDPAAFEASWPVVNVSDAKHQGYALQWFAMAVVLFLLFLHRSTNIWAVVSGRSSVEGTNG